MFSDMAHDSSPSGLLVIEVLSVAVMYSESVILTTPNAHRYFVR